MANAEKTDEPSGVATLPESIAPEADEVLLSKDGFRLFPQPILGDELDPLNWSFFRKHTILAIVMSL